MSAAPEAGAEQSLPASTTTRKNEIPSAAAMRFVAHRFCGLRT
jgi:hypothetical protein